LIDNKTNLVIDFDAQRKSFRVRYFFEGCRF